MRVAELDGAELSYWVARAENWPSLNWSDGRRMTQSEWIAAFPSSIEWNIAGPIIQKAKINMRFDHHMWWSDVLSQYADQPGRFGYEHEDYLVAAMRAYVASKFGEEVEDAPQDAG